jgi:hypothetical protein
MDPTRLLPFPHASTDPIERDLAEIDAAIGLVTLGVATRVRLVGLMRAEAVAGAGLARAQDAGVSFRLEHSEGGGLAVTLGPRNDGRR